MATQSNGRVVAGVPDLFFASKITETARQLGVAIEFASSEPSLIERARTGPALMLLDLGAVALRPCEAIARIKNDPATRAIRVIGFVNHERTDLIEQASAAGCDQVLTRGAFAKQLPELLGQIVPSDRPIGA